RQWAGRAGAILHDAGEGGSAGVDRADGGQAGADAERADAAVLRLALEELLQVRLVAIGGLAVVQEVDVDAVAAEFAETRFEGGPRFADGECAAADELAAFAAEVAAHAGGN